MKVTLPARIALFAMLVYGFPQTSAATCYVNGAVAGGNHDGTSWTNAYTDLQSALVNYLACGQVWIARGTYKPTPTADRTISFNVKPGLVVLGGFAGTEAVPADRVLGANPTILSGDIGIPGDSSDNSYHVVVFDGTTANGVILPSTLLVELTISDGNANGAGANEGFGGGVYCNGQGAGHTCNPQLTRVILENNSAQIGGAIYDDGHGGGESNPNLLNSIVRNNQASVGGGGIYNGGSGGGRSSPAIDSVTFTGNAADQGGAIFNYGLGGTSNPTISNSTFYANTAFTHGGAMLNDGASGGHASPIIRYSTFYKNRVINGLGGAMYNFAPSADAAPNLSGVILWADSPNENYTSFSATISTIEFSISPECPQFANGCINSDPLLGQLQYNDGFAPTLRPGIGSLAVDNGDAAQCPATDERGISRPQGSGCDIGAVEVRTGERHRCYVNGANSSPGIGWGWETSFNTIYPAYTSSTCTEVWVAKGTYTANNLFDPAAFGIPPGKQLYGGFAGTETALDQRDLAHNETILDGQGTYHVVLIDATGAATNVGGSTVLDGFTIKGGNANGASSDQQMGGGLLCNGSSGFSCNPTLSNLVFSGNHAKDGGALANYGFNGASSPTLTNVVFTGNQASNNGGAMLNLGTSGASNPVLNAVTFTGNYATHNGGAMASSASGGGFSDAHVSNSTFTGNSSSFGGGAVYLYAANGSFSNTGFLGNTATAIGGAVNIDDLQAPCSATFASVGFFNNTAGSGGAVNVAGTRTTTILSFDRVNFAGNMANSGGNGGALSTGGGVVAIWQSIFSRNSASNLGGALYAYQAGVAVDGSSFVRNTAAGGGAMHLAGVGAQITNSTFWDNSNSGVTESGGAIAAVRSDQGMPVSVGLQTVTFSKNFSTNLGGALYVDAAGVAGGATATIDNSIFWLDNSAADAEVHAGAASSVTLDHSIVYDGPCPANSTCGTVSTSDPKLGRFQYYGGFTPTLAPAADSPALDAGVSCPAVDQRGVVRPQGAACDLGAVERRAIEDYLFNDGFDF